MAKRAPAVDVLHEIRRAQRILRRVQRSLVAAERAAKRHGEKAKEAAELKQLAAQTRADFAADAERQREQRTIASFTAGDQL